MRHLPSEYRATGKVTRDEMITAIRDLLACVTRDTPTGECRYCGRDNGGYQHFACVEECPHQTAVDLVHRAETLGFDTAV